MKTILSLKRHHYVARVGIFLIVVALIAGMVGCGGDGGVVEYDLTVASTAGGSVSTPGEGTFTYSPGTVINLTALAEEGYRLVNWTGDASTIGNVNHTTTTIVMNGDYSVTANFTARAMAVDVEWQQYTGGANVCALVDDGDDLWVGSYGGLTKLDKATANMTHYNTANSGLPDNMISSIAKDVNGDWWIGTDNGLAKFDGTNWTVYKSDNSPLPRNDITCLAIDADGNKWIGVFMGGLVKFDGTNWIVYDTPIDDFRSIAIDSDGNKWIGGYADGGLAKFDGSNWIVYTQDNSGLPGKWADCITIDADGSLWMGSEGVAKFDGTDWTAYNKSNSPLPHNRVRTKDFLCMVLMISLI